MCMYFILIAYISGSQLFFSGLTYVMDSVHKFHFLHYIDFADTKKEIAGTSGCNTVIIHIFIHPLSLYSSLLVKLNNNH